MKHYPKLIILLIALSCYLPLMAQQKPNIIVILADDLGYGDLGCYGQQMIRTPHLDEMASAGMRFTHYYAGSTVCAPSRVALLTGVHTGHSAIRGNFLTDEEEDPPLPDSAVTIAELLKKAGYQTAIIGKWGLGGVTHGPQFQGFDYSFGYLDQIKAHNYYPPYLWENGHKIPLEGNLEGLKTTSSQQLFVQKTITYLDSVGTEHPFFLYLPYTYPHGAYSTPVDSEYKNKDWPQVLKVYASMISTLDRNVQQIMETLKKRGLDRNTLLLFTSDNGANPAQAHFFRSNGGLRGGKRELYEGGIRSPLIAYWPGRIRGGQVSGRIVASWDLVPTLCQLAGIKPPAACDGISFLPTLKEQRQPEHPYLYWEFYAYNYNWYKPGNKLPRNYLASKALRLGRWKAIQKYLPDGKPEATELYDLSRDSAEQKNVAGDNPALVHQVSTLFRKAGNPDLFYFPYVADSLAPLHIFNLHNAGDTKAFLHYSNDRIPLVSSHRGGPARGYPENCLATFTHTLRHTWSLLEIDPHYTKDSVIILMHDPTLDRTSTGHGKISDHSLAEIKQLFLKDRMGEVTQYKIPTLDEALEWAKGRAILILDQKDVSAATRARIVRQHHAEANAMVMCYSYEDARTVYQIDPNIMMEVFIPDEQSLRKFGDSGVPWKNVVAFVSHYQPKDPHIFEKIHEKGVSCIMGSSRTLDKDYLAEKISKTQLDSGYQRIIHSGADLIEADLGSEAGDGIRSLQDLTGSRGKYLKTSTSLN